MASLLWSALNDRLPFLKPRTRLLSLCYTYTRLKQRYCLKRFRKRESLTVVEIVLLHPTKSKQKADKTSELLQNKFNTKLNILLILKISIYGILKRIVSRMYLFDAKSSYAITNNLIRGSRKSFVVGQ